MYKNFANPIQFKYSCFHMTRFNSREALTSQLLFFNLVYESIETTKWNPKNRDII